MLAEKRFKTGNLGYSAYVVVTNVLDRKDCVQVYPTTGQCDAGSLNTYRGLTGPGTNGSVDENAVGRTGVTTTQFDHPELYRERRSISTGLKVSF
jgi:hypothetical protein